ncbi:predicted protein [Chaetomium globosum CBS 148.51]|uniref:Uncharacterized protein n=1 Tax=Chaetomium globosum (strain ATCC 6205 / CBS 148.51 / DSM 1962 / NBRC 6347 / NRRL 1970) TaxID=306901 RepID=Q2HCX4_CHAGB|nr:uncharacterized protein CHGG_01930 [Chaetomium globosum CBS 148.51]EAQ93695.1 predicted protein [Chaetomium globosum CBS 148.51]
MAAPGMERTGMARTANSLFESEERFAGLVHQRAPNNNSLAGCTTERYTTD